MESNRFGKSPGNSADILNKTCKRTENTEIRSFWMAVQTTEQAAKESFIDKLVNFIQRRRKILLISGIILIIVLVGLVVALEIRKYRLEKSAVMVESIEQQYEEWLTVKTEAEKENAESSAAAEADSLETEMVQQAETLIADYNGTYAAQKAADILAGIAFRKHDWEKAAELWAALAGKYTNSYLAPIALLNAAASWEEAGKPDKSVEALRTVLAQYSATFPYIPRVLFSMGRFAEKNETFEDAKTHYNRLIDEYPGSSWTKLARDRIIFLRAQNKISE
jgi:tetratricopeptide (TPR) repeat protein